MKLRPLVITSILACLTPSIAAGDPPLAVTPSCGSGCVYVARQGDYVDKLEKAFGVEPGALWNHPDNARLKSRRQSNLLHPGDVMRVPSAASGAPKAGAKPRDVATVNVRFTGTPNQPYTVEGLGTKVEGLSDPQGVVSVEVPVDLREYTITFTKLKTTYPIRVGGMEPVTEPSGARLRLENLGYRPGAADKEDVDERDREAISAFQRAQGLEVTGILDEATRAALVIAHGS